MHKTTTVMRPFFVFGVFVLLFSGQLNAQIVIGAPNLGFTSACAGEAFNTYNVTFAFTSESGLNSTNQFKLELSDATGNFSNAVVVYTSQPGAITSSPATLTFQLPEDTAGEGYKLRVKSTAPAASSGNSVAFAAYYKLHDSSFTINNFVSTGAFCTGGSYLLAIDEVSGSGSYGSPLNFPSLTYKWYKQTSPTTTVYAGEGNTLTVTQPGTYYVRTNYGSCSSDSYSNQVTISEISSGNTETNIVSSLGNPFCAENGKTTLKTIGGMSYQWFKNGTLISGATQQTYETNSSGTYSVKVDLGSCSATGTIELKSQGFESSINVAEHNQIDSGESLTVTVTTNATNPKFEWYYNDTQISGATSDTFNATAYGNYKVVVSQTTGCLVSEEYVFTLSQTMEPFPEVEKIPNLISPNGDGVNDTWIIPTKYVAGSNATVIIMNNQGKVVLQTTSYMNNWPQNQLELNSINQVFYYIITTTDQQTKKGSITVVK